MDNSKLIAAIKGSNSKGLSTAESSALEFISGSNAGFQSTLDKEADEAKRKNAAALLKAEVDKKKDEARKLKDSLTTDQFLFTDMTEGRLPKSGVNHVMFQYPVGTWDPEFDEDIPEVDPFFFWDADVLEDIWLAYSLNENWLGTGPPGTGKSSCAKQLAAWLRQPFARFNGKDGIEPASFLGYPWATKEGMIWQDGLMPQAVANGYLTCIDEVFKLPPGIQMALQSLYEKDGFLMLDEKPGTIKDKHIYPRKEFRIIGTDNTKGTGDDLDKYGAGQMQDTSTLDRWGITTDVPYLPKREEIAMFVKRFPSLDKKVISKVVSMANLVRNSFLSGGELSLTMSPRGVMVACELLGKNVPLDKALKMAYVNKLSDDIELKTANGFINSCI